ncbi:MAG TPA: trypsin-like peptidase domain-containing protein [Streptosporangiaceae bacterium]|nr:trypsin-like peptidase domain-containing protein [Streptosporangiaceae bacterium]
MRDDQGRDDQAGAGPDGTDAGRFGSGGSDQPTAGKPWFGQDDVAGFGGLGTSQPYSGPSGSAPSYGPGQPGYGDSTDPGRPFPPPPPGPGQSGHSSFPPPGQPGYGNPAFGQTAAFGPSGPLGPSGAYGQPGGYLAPPTDRARRRRSLLTYVIVAVVAAAAGAGTTAYFVGNSPASISSSPQQQQNGGTGNNGGGNSGNIPAFPNYPSGGSSGNSGNDSGITSAKERAVINAVRPGLVDISSNLQYQGSQAAATGMVISSDGLVLTNNHVITDTTQLYAITASGVRYPARWLGYDSTDDVAVIKLVNAHNLKTVPLGDSSSIKVGTQVVAMGNANGAGGITPAPGRITGLNKTITASDSGEDTKETLHNMLQTNAGIVQGDSGGALASASGRVIGMNTAAATGTFDSPDVGFAIPINRALSIAEKIIHGQASSTIQVGSTGFMGVLVPAGQASQSSSPKQQRDRQLQQDETDSGFPLQPASPACLANDLTAGVPSKVAPVGTGALIIGQLCNTPAAKAGIIPGDVITAVGSDKVTSPSELTKVMLRFKPGDSVQVTWVDIKGQTHKSTMVLIEAPPH